MCLPRSFFWPKEDGVIFLSMVWTPLLMQVTGRSNVYININLPTWGSAINELLKNGPPSGGRRHNASHNTQPGEWSGRCRSKKKPWKEGLDVAMRTLDLRTMGRSCEFIARGILAIINKSSMYLLITKHIPDKPMSSDQRAHYHIPVFLLTSTVELLKLSDSSILLGKWVQQ